MARTPRWTPPATPFTAAHVHPLGVTPEMLRWAVKSRRITRLAHGVFIASDALAKDPAGRHLQLALAYQLRNPEAIASHETAALAWGLDLADERTAATQLPRFITGPGPVVRSGRTRNAVTAVRALPTHHRVAHPSGLIVTTAARAAVDIAAESELGPALVVLDSVARTTLREMVGERRMRAAYTDERALDRSRAALLEAVRTAATRPTRRWLEEVVPQADPRREAPSESASFALIVGAGLPRPELQVRIETDEGDAYPDFLWAGARVIGEVDGKVKYTNPEALVNEKRRQESLERMGFLFVRWLPDEVHVRPRSIIQRLQWALDSRA